MLHAGLLILKILGILLLSILGLICAFLCLVLFLPVFYRLDAEKDKDAQMNGKVSWLLGALSIVFRAGWKEGFQGDVSVHIFGISLDRLKNWHQKREKKKTGTKKAKKKPEKKSGKVPEKASTEQKKQSLSQKAETKEELPGEKKQIQPVQQPEEKSSRKRWHPKETIRNIYDKIKGIGAFFTNVWEKKQAFTEFWNREEHVRARQALKKEAGYIWRKSRPRKVSGELIFGFDDPSWTGMCTGILSTLYAWYPDKFYVHPDFEQEIFRGEIHIRGRVQIYAFCLTAFHLWKNPDIRLMYHEWKR